MRNTQLLSLSFVAGFSVFSSACEEDLGNCDETKARSLVINGEGQVLYAGQAIINRSCAAGQCHASGAEGKLRQGVPAGLDFDLEPVSVATGDEDSVTSNKLKLSAKGLSRLRKNQRLVFDEREEIWEQIQDGLMPPDGVGQAFREVNAASLADLKKPCQITDALAPIKDSETKDILRNWLACGGPVVEASSTSISNSNIRDVEITKDGKKKYPGEPGTVGQQLPLCEGDCDSPITFDALYAKVISQSCVAGCHEPGGQWPTFDLGDIDKAYDTLTKSTGGSESCNGKEIPAVVPGDAMGSYIVAKMGGEADAMLCGALMPYGQLTPLDCGLRQTIAWINAGAPKPGEKVDGASSGDAGM